MPEMPPLIFISYRHEDAGVVGRIAEKLTADFGNNAVFVDTQTLKPGTKWNPAIARALEEAGAVLVIIGRQWLTAAHPSGTRRLDDPDDTLTAEIVEALSRDKFIVPLLVDHATIPSRSELPEPLKPLADIQAIALRNSEFEYGYGKLIEALKAGAASLALRQEELRRERHATQQGETTRKVLGGVVIAVIVIVGAWWIFSNSRGFIRDESGRTITWATTALGVDTNIAQYRCPPAPVIIEGAVYGTFTYSTDSPICAAALHAGKITRDGGFITVRLRGRVPAFLGSGRNGITSLDLKESRQSFIFE